MEARRKVVDYYRKIRDRIKGRMKKAFSCNWPEPSRYCGCCTLSTGIYIRSVVVIIVTIITIGINSTILHFLLNIAYFVKDEGLAAIEELVGPDADWESLYFLYRAIVIYYILWIGFKIVYILIVFWTVYAVYKKSTKMLKFLIYISIPNLIFDFIISLAGTILLYEKLKILLLICILSEGYNILAMNSEYKKMRGKKRLVVEYGTGSETSNTQSIYPDNFVNQPDSDRGDLRFRPGYNLPHCQSCTCYNSVSESPPAYTNGGEIESPAETPTSSDPIINPNTPNDNRLALRSNYANVPNISHVNNTEIAETEYCNNGNHARRPKTLNIPINRVKDVKVHLSDDPIIYDERQLNVGTSSVIEDRPT